MRWILSSKNHVVFYSRLVPTILILTALFGPSRSRQDSTVDSKKNVILNLGKAWDRGLRTPPYFPPSSRWSMTNSRLVGGRGYQGAPYSINCYSCNIFVGGGEERTNQGGTERGNAVGPSSTWDDGDITTAAIAIHNKLRAKHGAEPLTSNDTLITGAQNWANARLSGAARGYSKRKGVGENIHWQAGTDPFSVDEVVNAGVNDWYSEIDNYDWSRPGESTNDEAIGHFTQVVWVDSQQIGCAMSSGPHSGPNWSGSQYYLVCQYWPQGNSYYTGRKPLAYRENVLPSVSSRKK